MSKTIIKGLLIVVLCVLCFVGGAIMKKTVQFVPIEVGHTTFEELMEVDPNAKAICTSYGYITHHKLHNGKIMTIDFVYRDGQFIADSYEILDQ